ncbi:hypothetical protein WH87_03955 [Devosia epidermidihirudinis]|uniref:Uncharacterized protein n=1 Tax=Devosia epidermidihirudinis TaxID=1293439 RepID=A0A0F5QEF1_9HYPH|nr:hypothetical protein [Devosia epidermidihirudinis]KKC39377.1 hypothetical protein WH87_03955 [Devosia epidermidihirudinis]
MWARSSDGQGGHYLLFAIGIVALIAGALVWHFGTAKYGWPVAQARVMSVEVECQIQLHSLPLLSRRRSDPFVIPCDQVERFAADNPSRSWNLNRIYSGNVEVTRDGRTVGVFMNLGGASNQRVGADFEVIQNPENLTQVTRMDQAMAETYAGGGLAGFGIFVLAIVFFWT